MASGTMASSTSYWIKFFTEAGIPAGEATNYAITFSDNRIQEDMLMDLNKEYLADMGITTLGDVISILRHAKATHTKIAREKALKGTSVTNSPSSGTASPVPARRSTPASRFVDHYLGKDPDAKPMNSSPVIGSKMSKELASRLGPSPQAPSPTPSGRGKQTIKLSSKQEDVIPVPRVRRVLPEHEGKYKVIMPSGTTNKTKNLIDKGNKVEKKKKSSVFQRLGQERSESPSSSSSDSPKVTITGLGSKTLSRSSADATSASVFKRLGGKAVKRPATSTVICDNDDMDSEDVSDLDEVGALEYAGILKNPGTPVKQKKITVTLRTTPTATKQLFKKKTVPTPTEVSTSTEGIFARLADGVPVKSRLGKPVASPKISTSKSRVSTTTSAKEAVKKDIHSRLGPQHAQKTEVTSSTESNKAVFKRLGKFVKS